MDHDKKYNATKDPLKTKNKSTEHTKPEVLTKEFEKKIKLIEKAFR